ncbi:hypothetical protein [Idiomarina abyssalis]|uniref:hypothetical protein n=1 Tax=Idiomarina abyssalis TaxID=86102 RepID=UPI001C97434C|nr:hypothetical protein [Idiomarina abyssalis]QZN91579.1 hypothetical protein K5X84_03445 [Idiomarina abyssalis]
MKTNLQFKGGRTYLHSTDFYDWLMGDVCEGDEWVTKLVFKKIINHQCEIVWEKTEDQSSGFFELWNRQADSIKRGWLVETREAAVKRYDYDEDSLVSVAEIDEEGQSIHMNRQCSASTIEVIVALTKKLHNTLFPLSSGKWLVGQLEFLGPLPISYKTVGVNVDRIIKGKFSVCSITIDGDTVGSIRFIVGDPDDRH